LFAGQVHDYKVPRRMRVGGFLAIDAGLIPDLYRTVLEDPFLATKTFGDE